jgi:osmotically-inducible protein OsmY
VEIHKAINNRAITGVQVSVVGGIAFLDGRVETERQKAAAEEAARSVPAIKYIRNRIEVNFPSGYEGAAGPAS